MGNIKNPRQTTCASHRLVRACIAAGIVLLTAAVFVGRADAAAVTFDPDADNWISSCSSGCTVNNGAGTELRVRSAALWGDIKNFRSLLRFDLSGLSVDPRRISRATLNIYYYKYHWNNPCGRQYVVQRVTSAWSELECTWQARDLYNDPDPLYWNGYLSGVPAYQPGGGDVDPLVYASAEVPDIGDGVPFDETWMTWDVTELVLEWVGAVHPNEGVIVKDAEEYEEYVEDIAWGPAQFLSTDYYDDAFWPYVEVTYIGDGDDDGDVDLDDHAVFGGCMFGPQVVPDPEEDCLDAFDADLDGDVDLRDFAAFQRAMGAVDP